MAEASARTGTAGRDPVVLIDDAADRAVLVLAAQHASAAAVAFVVRHGSGFLAAAAPAPVLEGLRIPLSPVRDRAVTDHEFGIAVDAVGTGTGISALARAETLRRLADPASAPEDFVRPGHVTTVRVTPPAGHGGRRWPFGRWSLPAASIEVARAGGAAPVAGYTHLLGLADPTGLADAQEARAFAETHGLVVGSTDLVVSGRAGRRLVATSTG